MLDGLDDVPWPSLTHAYGPAGDVPALIRALAQPGEQQGDVLIDLHGCIWHQGTVYEASSYAVPFLVELALEPTLTRRDEILSLIGGLATGNSYLNVHAQPENKAGAFFRDQPDFEEKLEKELHDVQRTRLAVFEQLKAIASLMDDPNPMVRCTAVYVLSRFPEHITEVGPLMRRAAKNEPDPLSAAGMLWCLGYSRDASPEAATLLYSLPKDFADPRPAFAAAIALHRLQVEPDDAAISKFRQLAAATWFAESCLVGVPWDFTGEIPLEPLLAEIEPDAKDATEMLMPLLNQASLESYTRAAIVRDLLHMNFEDGHWKQTNQLTDIQKEVLRRIVDTQLVWDDPKRLWFLVPDGSKMILKLTSSDLQKVRDEMRDVIQGRRQTRFSIFAWIRRDGAKPV